MNEAEDKILSSLSCGKMLGAGQNLRVLSKVAFGDCSHDSIKKTQKILYRLKKNIKSNILEKLKFGIYH